MNLEEVEDKLSGISTMWIGDLAQLREAVYILSDVCEYLLAKLKEQK